MNRLDENQIEKILGSLPVFERDKKAERIFFEKLHRMAAQKKEIGTTKIEPARSWFSWPRLAFAGSFAALLIMVGGTVWAYQSGVTRGHFLYPLKKAAERIELALAVSPLQKIDAHLRFSDRRLEEAHALIKKYPSLAWLIPAAQAHEGEIHLDSDEEIRLADTLNDMRAEVSAASEIVENAMSKVEEIQAALSKIETATDRHIDRLEQLEKQTSKNTQAIVKKIAKEEDDHLSKVLDAEDEIEEARGKKLERVQINLLRREIKHQQRNEKATEELQKTLELFQSLSEEEKKGLADKMERAEEALQSGKFGRVQGLSKALKNRMEHMEPQAERQNIYNDPKLSPPQPKTIEKHSDKPFIIKLQDVKGGEEKSEDKKKSETEELDDFEAPVNPTKKIRLVDPEDIRDLQDIDHFEPTPKELQNFKLKENPQSSEDSI